MRRSAGSGGVAPEGARSLGRPIAQVRNRPRGRRTMIGERIGVVVVARSGPGVLHELTGVIAQHSGNIASVDIFEERPPDSRIYFAIDLPVDATILQADLKQLDN